MHLPRNNNAEARSAGSAVLAIVLAGGEGTRLRPLTAEQAKPAVPFADGHRIVDFVLGNLVNSRVPWIYVLAQYKPESLIEHVESQWARWYSRQGGSMEVLLPSDRGEAAAFRGTADAVHRNLWLLERHQPDVVAVFAADHIYRMDVRQMVAFHRERDADVTVAALPVALEEAARFGVISTEAAGRIRRFDEKPACPQPIPADPTRALASMGNYLFKARALQDMLRQVAQVGGTDFGRDMLPFAAERGWRCYAYDFSRNRVPGVRAYEERAYWRDVGTLEALVEARRDVHGPWPRLDLANRRWPIRRDRLVDTPVLAQSAHPPRPAAGLHEGGVPRLFAARGTALRDPAAESALAGPLPQRGFYEPGDIARE